MNKKIFTTHDILSYANDIVKEYPEKGWLIQYGDSSFGYRFRVDLGNGQDYVRVRIEERSKNFDLSLMEVVVMPIPAATSAYMEPFEAANAEPLHKKVFYGRYNGKDVYTDDEAEAETWLQKWRTRGAARNSLCETGTIIPIPITPTNAFIRKLKTRPGFSGANMKNTRITRRKYGYCVCHTTSAGKNHLVQVSFPYYKNN